MTIETTERLALTGGIPASRAVRYMRPEFYDLGSLDAPDSMPRGASYGFRETVLAPVNVCTIHIQGR